MSQTIHSHTLPNGLTIVAEVMDSVESAAFTLGVAAGCASDPPGRAGLASFTAEMATRGSGSRDNRQYLTDLNNLGVDPGDSVSAAHTFFTGATIAENLIPALEIYADLVRRPHLPEDQLEPSRQGMWQELAAIDDDPSQKLMIELRKRHYPDPWGRSPEGDSESIGATTLDDIRRFHERCYRPDGAMVTVAGRIDWPRLKDRVEELFGDWKPRPLELPSEAGRGIRRDHLSQDTNQTQIGVAYDCVPYRHPDYFQAWGAVGVLSGGMSSRLFTEIREKRGLCYSVFATTHTLKDRGAVVCYAGTGADRAQETLDVLLAELLRLPEGVEATELKRLKARMKSSLIMQQESSSARSSAIARDWYHLGRVRTLDEISRLVDGLTAESISDYLKQNPPRDFTIITLGPQPLETPREVS